MSISGFNRIRTVFVTRTKRYLTHLWPIQTPPATKFIILCQPRTGSTLLHTYLNSHPAIYSYGEVLRRNHEKGKETRIPSEVYKSHPPMIKAVGLKVFYSYLDKPEYRSAVFEIAKDPAIKVIHLNRRNALDEFISLQKATLSGTWSQTRKTQPATQQQYTLDPADFLHFLKLRTFLKRRTRYIFQDQDFHEISYEDLLTDREKTLLEVQRFLGVKPKKLFSLLVRQGDPSHTDITNYEVLREVYDDFLKANE